MRVQNSEISAMLRKLADLLAIEGANPFRIRAYRQAARTIDALPGPVADMLDAGMDLAELPGIGKDLAQKIAHIVRTGDFPLLDSVMARTPPVLTELLQVPGLGPRKVEQLYETLGIETLEDFEKALQDGRVAALRGFGPRSVAKLAQAVATLRRKGPEKRWPIIAAVPVAEALLQHLRGFSGVVRVEMAGSFRRRKETVGDLDIVAEAENGPGLIRHFCTFPDVEQVELKGVTRGTVILNSGLHVDLRVGPAGSYGTMLAYFTGARAHTIALRKRAVQRGWKLNEYGLFDETGTALAGPDEAGIYAAFGLAPIPPELREMQGELEAAGKNALPDLVTGEQVQGDAHVKSGRDLAAQVRAARARGLRWVGIADAYRDADTLARQIAEIEALPTGAGQVRVLKSASVAIGVDGGLGIAPDLLARLDYLHVRIDDPAGLTEPAQTARLRKAMDFAAMHGVRLLLGRVTGRRLNAPPEWRIALDEVLQAAAAQGHVFEVNQRDGFYGLGDIECHRAVKHAARLALGSAAEDGAGLSYLEYALWQARRGWAEGRDMLNGSGLQKSATGATPYRHNQKP